jgi:hypothetical protein
MQPEKPRTCPRGNPWVSKSLSWRVLILDSLSIRWTALDLLRTRFGGVPVADPARTSASGPAPGRRPALLQSGFAEYIWTVPWLRLVISLHPNVLSCRVAGLPGRRRWVRDR